MQNKNRGFTRTLSSKVSGFTLIELLVVVAIIGVLAAVVTAALNSARGEGGDAGVKANLANIRNQAELQYATLGCYANSRVCKATTPVAYGPAACPAAGANVRIFYQSVIAAQTAAAKSAGGGGYTACFSNAGGKAWAVAVQLKSDKAKAWCVDSAGASKQVSQASAYANQGQINAEVNNAGVPVCGT